MKNAYLAICYVCNEDCKFCPCSKNEKKKKMLTDISELKKTVDEFEQDGVTDITISGGEPTLHPDLSVLISYIQSKKIKVTVLSNGEKFCDSNFIKKFIDEIDINLIKIITTLHGSISLEHEMANRTIGSFDRTIKGLQNLIENGVKVIIKHCITRDNYRKLLEFYQYCDQEFSENVDIQLCSIDYCGIPKEELNDQRLSFREVKPFLEEVFDYHISRKKVGNERKLYCINIPLCSCDVFYWNYFTFRHKKMYSRYKDPRNKTIENISDNVGVHTEYCKGCKAIDLCNGTYYTAYDVVGEELIQPLYEKDSKDMCRGDQIHYPEFFMIDLTNRCNLHCKYCLRNVDMKGKSISDKAVKDICNYIVEYCDEYRLRDITIQPWGGEPLLELDKILLMRKCISPKNTKVHFSIETNAVLLNEKILKILYDNKIGLGISIDGYEEIHNLQRVYIDGRGTHEIVETNLLLAQKKYGERLGTITTITKYNAPYVEQLLEYFVHTLKLSNVKFNYVHASMFTQCDALCLSKEEIAETELKILNKLVELNEKGYCIKEYNIGVKIKNLITGKYSDICNSCGCLGGRKMIVFDMYGNIFPCELTDTADESIGSIYDETTLPEIILEAKNKRDFYVAKKNEKCETCSWYPFCKGGCTVRTISAKRRPPNIDEIECAVNTSLYPALTKLISENPEIANRLSN